MVEMYSFKLPWTASLELMAAILIFPGEYCLFHMVPSSSSACSLVFRFHGARNQVLDCILAMVLVHSIHNQSLPIVTFILLGVLLHT